MRYKQKKNFYKMDLK